MKNVPKKIISERDLQIFGERGESRGVSSLKVESFHTIFHTTYSTPHSTVRAVGAVRSVTEVTGLNRGLWGVGGGGK
jgi:hypothetical protein